MNIDDVVSTFVGKIAWLPRRSLGSFVTIEFGSPLLTTREPIAGPKVATGLSRRRVTVRGQQHLWIQADDRTLQSDTWTATSADEKLSMSQRLECLAGSRLTTLEATKNGSIFQFEFGETLTLRPDPDPAQALWSIFWHTGGNASWLSGGELRLER